MARYQDQRVPVISRTFVEVLADRQLLDLALTQLLDNAVKYSRLGSAITVEIGDEKGFVAIIVKNEGNSIAPGERDRIFERFYRGARVRNLVSGSGLGLHVTRKIAAAHGGSLNLINDDRDEGVVFCLKLPTPEPSVLNHECDNRASSL